MFNTKLIKYNYLYPTYTSIVRNKHMPSTADLTQHALRTAECTDLAG